MIHSLLDVQRPFVGAVFAILDSGAAYDRAVDELVAAERRHGARIIREDRTGSLAAVWVPIGSRASIRELRELLEQFPSDEVLRRMVPGETPPAEWLQWEALWRARNRQGIDDAVPERPLFDFLTDTCFLVGGSDFANDHCIEYPAATRSGARRLSR
jgi:hypothetical protein